jgi:hypothetical protein
MNKIRKQIVTDFFILSPLKFTGRFLPQFFYALFHSICESPLLRYNSKQWITIAFLRYAYDVLHNSILQKTPLTLPLDAGFYYRKGIDFVKRNVKVKKVKNIIINHCFGLSPKYQQIKNYAFFISLFQKS